MYEEIERVLSERVRPLLHLHGGDLEVLSVEKGIVRFRFLGHCAGCPAADLTNEELVQTELMAHFPNLSGAVMVQETSEDLLAQARALMRHRHNA
ncbi:NifU family protein [Oscillibacter sp.]|uniref:NifU family protein n=1 Tax=Oscillibacter sp. TaxID=1945593 RepID=UPI0028AD8B29|nr:NifU family protein [Oscillibacter sp.]